MSNRFSNTSDFAELPPLDPPTFSAKQQIAFDMVRAGKSLFVTGGGGCGKSYLIKHIWRDAISRGCRIKVTALTGCAALLLECCAKTLHSFAGIGHGAGTVDDIVSGILESHFKMKGWRDVDMLIIDEVSMLSEKLIDVIDSIARAVRRQRAPFGGIQVVLFGDFYQLPPIGNSEEPAAANFCFQHRKWPVWFPHNRTIVLTDVFRQKDPQFIKILNQVRIGRLTRSSEAALLAIVGRQLPEGAVITRIFPLRAMVEDVNRREMAALDGPDYIYTTQNHTDLPYDAKLRAKRERITDRAIEYELAYMRKNMRCDANLCLRLGAHVMCIVNKDIGCNRVVNGSQGVIIGWEEVMVSQDGELKTVAVPKVRFNAGFVATMVPHVWPSSEIPGVGISQIPLILAWAVTIHKTQGATFDAGEINIGNAIFECGQTYVALSRLSSLDGLYLTAFSADRIRINPVVQEFYDAIDVAHRAAAETAEPAETAAANVVDDPTTRKITVHLR